MHKGINTTCDEGQTPVLAMSFDWQKGNDVNNARPSTMNVKEEQSQTLSSTRVPAVAFTKSKRAQSTTDDESWVPGEVAPTFNCFNQGDTRATTVVAFTQNSRDEVRQVNGDGQLAGALSAAGGMHITNYVAQAIGFDGFQSDNPKATHQATIEGTGPLIRGRPHCVATPMAVRRLTPRECERLQGFADDYTAIEYRKKPAADGPRYKALGNSMAVPVMAWIGKRIAALAAEERMPA